MCLSKKRGKKAKLSFFKKNGEHKNVQNVGPLKILTYSNCQPAVNIRTWVKIWRLTNDRSSKVWRRAGWILHSNRELKWYKTLWLILVQQTCFPVFARPRAHEWDVWYRDVTIFFYLHICPVSFPSNDSDGLVTHTRCQAHKSAFIPPQWHQAAISRSPRFNQEQLPTD